MGYDNLARKSEALHTTQPRKKINRRKKEEFEMLQRKRLVARIFCIITVALAASYMVSQFVEVKDKKSELMRLNSKYAHMQASTLQKQRDYNDSDAWNGTSLEDEAERLQMQRPDKNQIVYVEVDREDETEATAVEVEGFGKRFKTVVGDFFSNIVKYFSIS